MHFVYVIVYFSKAIGNAFNSKNEVALIIAVCSVLFFVSDLMLVFNWFMDCGKWSLHLCMATYYPINCLLAFSMLIKITRKNK